MPEHKDIEFTSRGNVKHKGIILDKINTIGQFMYVVYADKAIWQVDPFTKMAFIHIYSWDN